MNYREELSRIMQEQTELALATSVEEKPNVRIVNFCPDHEKPGILYFASFKNNPKTKEFARNGRVAFTTVPKSGNAHIRCADAAVSKSALTIFDLKEEFCRRIEGYDQTIEFAGKKLIVYEIRFNEVTVTVDMAHTGRVKMI